MDQMIAKVLQSRYFAIDELDHWEESRALFDVFMRFVGRLLAERQNSQLPPDEARGLAIMSGLAYLARKAGGPQYSIHQPSESMQNNDPFVRWLQSSEFPWNPLQIQSLDTSGEGATPHVAEGQHNSSLSTTIENHTYLPSILQIDVPHQEPSFLGHTPGENEGSRHFGSDYQDGRSPESGSRSSLVDSRGASKLPLSQAPASTLMTTPQISHTPSNESPSAIRSNIGSASVASRPFQNRQGKSHNNIADSGPRTRRKSYAQAAALPREPPAAMPQSPLPPTGHGNGTSVYKRHNGGCSKSFDRKPKLK